MSACLGTACRVILAVVDKIGLFRLETLERWQQDQQEAAIGLTATRAANERDLTLMSPEEHRRLANRVEAAYLHRRLNGRDRD